MDANELLVRLATVHSVASKHINLDAGINTAKDSDVERRAVPFMLYHVKLDYDENGNPIDGEVIPIKVTRYGTHLNCSKPTIDFFDTKSKRNRSSSVSFFYLTQEDAQAEINFAVALTQQERAKKELNSLMEEYLPYLLESVDIAKLTENLKQVDNN